MPHSSYINPDNIAQETFGDCVQNYKSKTNATLILPLVDRAYLYDNSIENETPRLICRMVDGTLFKQYSDTIPEWAKDLLK